MLLSKLEVLGLEVSLIPEDSVSLPPYIGSMLRGSFGMALKDTFCVTRKLDCMSCIVRDNCGYFQIFEPKRDETKNNGYYYLPKPYILDFNIGKRKKEPLTFRMVLFGDIIKHTPYCLLTFQRMGERGLGKGRKKFSVQSVKLIDFFDDKNSKIIFAPEQNEVLPYQPTTLQTVVTKKNEFSECVRVKILTPLKMQHKRKVCTDFHLEAFIESIKRRYETLHYFYGVYNENDIANFSTIKLQEKNIQYKGYMRYSSRQNKKHKLSGIIGDVFLTSLTPHSFWLLKAMEILHVGKNTAFGLGKIQVENVK